MVWFRTMKSRGVAGVLSALLATAAVVTTTAAPATARADTIWIGGATGAGADNSIEMAGVRITGVRDGRLQFTAAGGGRDGDRALGDVARVAADDEPALNSAEAALAANQLDAATDAFRKALAASAREWVKHWAAYRLATIAPRANRFDAAAAGYVALLVRDPARAAAVKPPLPAAQSTFLAAAAAEADAALATPGLSPASREALETFSAELQLAQAPAGAAGGGGTAPPLHAARAQPAADASSPAVSPAASPAVSPATSPAQQAAREKLAVASAAVDRKDFQAAINEIRANSKIFTDARDQAQALYLLAEAQTGLALAKNDVPAWQDAALAYLRVVAHFKDAAPPARAFAARAMLKAAQICETVRDPAAARALYEQLTGEFPADPAAADARAALERLKAKP